MENNKILDSEIITSQNYESSLVSSILNYKAITKEKIMPTRDYGIGKIMIEIVDLYLLSNTLILRDWVIVYDENGNEVYKQIIKDVYQKKYTDEQFTQMFLSCNINLSNNETIYRNIKEVIDIASLIINQIDPPYGLAPNSFEKYISNI